MYRNITQTYQHTPPPPTPPPPLGGGGVGWRGGGGGTCIPLQAHMGAQAVHTRAPFRAVPTSPAQNVAQH